MLEGRYTQGFYILNSIFSGYSTINCYLFNVEKAFLDTGH